MRGKCGFTLLELSIVLVIIGLIAGGIMGGADLLRSAELRGVEKDMTKYRAAFLTFKDKYNAIPGDFSDATKYWGALNATTATCYGLLGTGAVGTCNGNGDGFYEDGYVYAFWSAAQTTPESYLAWHHLSLAGLIDKTLNGSNGNLTIGVNVPKTSRDQVTMIFAPVLLYGKSGAGLRLTHPDSVWFDFGALSISDAQALDSKLDDGSANSGTVYAAGTNASGGGPECTGSGWWQIPGTDYLNQASADINAELKCTLTMWLN